MGKGWFLVQDGWMKSSALPGHAQGRDWVVLGPAWGRGIPARAGLSCSGAMLCPDLALRHLQPGEAALPPRRSVVLAVIPHSRHDKRVGS